MVVELKEHQQIAVDKLDYGKILYGGVGGGKTVTSLAFFYTKVMGGVLNDPHSIRRPKRIIVITTAKVRDSLDWQKTASWFSISDDEACSLPGVTITVDSWNNIGKYTEVEDAFFVFDEQRLVGSGAWVKSFLKIARSNGWILLSATPGDTWFDYLPVFIANGFFKNKTEFTREHVVWQPYTKFPKVLRYTGVNKLVKMKNKVLVEMPFERHTIRDVVDYMVDYDIELFNKVVKERWHPFEERPIRDVAELFLVMRKVVNSDASRAEAVRKLWRKHPKLIVFYNFDYELMELRKLAENPPSPIGLVSHTSHTPTETSTSKTSKQERSTGATPSKSSVPTSTTSMSDTSTSSPTETKNGESSRWTQDNVLLSSESLEDRWESSSKAKSGTDSGTSTLKSRSAQSSTRLSSVKTLPSTSASTSPTTSQTSSSKPERSSETNSSESSSDGTPSPTTKSSRPSTTSSPALSTRRPSSIESTSLGNPTSETGVTGVESEEPQPPSTGKPSSVTAAAKSDLVNVTTTGSSSGSTVSSSLSTAAVAEWNGHKHEPIPQTDQWLYLVQYQAGAEGWNCVETDAMVFYSLTYSYKNFMQAQGRIDRLNTPFKHLKYYVLLTTSAIDRAVRKSLSDKKSFNESKYYPKFEEAA